MSEDTIPNPTGAESHVSQSESQTAQDYIAQQLQLEADAREALPYQFDTCTKPLGPLRQSLFSCLTCNPPSQTPYIPAGVCYSCSISCHGEHELVELFSKRDFECDCGTTRTPDSAPCTLRSNPTTGLKGGVTQDTARPDNKYNQNYTGRFCGCGDEYDPAKEKGTMFQCLGLGHVDSGGCGEDWWHPECLMGLPRQVSTTESKGTEDPVSIPANGNGTNGSGEQVAEHIASEAVNDDGLPPGFPAEDQFDHLLCYKCVEANPWTKPYAGSSGFLPPIHFKESTTESQVSKASTVDSTETPATGLKRKLDDADSENGIKRSRINENTEDKAATEQSEPAPADLQVKPAADHTKLSTPASGKFSILVKEDFRDHLCRCPECFPRLSKFPQLLDIEDPYEPPVSESDDGEGQGGSVGSKSLLDRGEAALSTMDRMRAIEGVMAYNNLRDKVKVFLQPFAESGQAVGAEDVKAYFARLRGDEDDIRTAASGANPDESKEDDNRHEQSGY